MAHLIDWYPNCFFLKIRWFSYLSFLFGDFSPVLFELNVFIAQVVHVTRAYDRQIAFDRRMKRTRVGELGVAEPIGLVRKVVVELEVFVELTVNLVGFLTVSFVFIVLLDFIAYIVNIVNIERSNKTFGL